jgi:hypothetical protein
VCSNPTGVNPVLKKILAGRKISWMACKLNEPLWWLVGLQKDRFWFRVIAAFMPIHTNSNPCPLLWWSGQHRFSMCAVLMQRIGILWQWSSTSRSELPVSMKRRCFLFDLIWFWKSFAIVIRGDVSQPSEIDEIDKINQIDIIVDNTSIATYTGTVQYYR